KTEQEHKQVDFDFLINGEFLRLSLGEHLEEKGVSTETVVDIEYVEKFPSPKPVGSVLHDDWISTVRGHSGRILTGCYDNHVRLWNKDGSAIATLEYHSEPVKSVAWIKNEEDRSLFASGSHDQTLLLWEWKEDSNTHRCLYCCRGHSRSVDSLAVDSSGSRICSASFDKTIKIWSTEIEDNPSEESEQERKKVKTENPKPATRTPLITLEGHKEAVSSVLWIGENEVCSASWDHTMNIWDVTTATHTSSLTGTKAFLSISYSPLSKLLASGSVDRHVRLWDPREKSGSVVHSSLTHHAGWVSSVAWSPDNQHQLLSGGYDKQIKMWDIRSPKAPLFDMSGIKDKVLAVDWSIAELLLCGAADNNLHIFSSGGVRISPSEEGDAMER
ncbi:putative ribosome biogenesis protein WDR12-like, partial [Apostichopus japonicus]